MAVAALAVPWALVPTLLGVTASDVLAPQALWEAVWPILLGGALALGLRRFAHALPSLPEGDVVALGGHAARATRACADALERADGLLSQWPVAGVSLLALAVLLAATMLAGS
jgi:hypothetical protein